MPEWRKYTKGFHTYTRLSSKRYQIAYLKKYISYRVTFVQLLTLDQNYSIMRRIRYRGRENVNKSALTKVDGDDKGDNY